MSEKLYTACVIIIGNEILSGRTKDINLSYLAEELNKIGIRVMECRVIPDIAQVIVDTVNECRQKFTYIFTTGGIGPTHDDITTACIADAFGVKLIRHPEADAILRKHYGDQINDARLKMADIPEGATLIPNRVSAAPGFVLGNVYVLAGVPNIMRAMFDELRPALKGGAPMLSESVAVMMPEGQIAKGVSDIQNAYPEIEIGSYPFIKDGKLSTNLVLRGTNGNTLAKATQDMRAFLEKAGAAFIEAA